MFNITVYMGTLKLSFILKIATLIYILCFSANYAIASNVNQGKSITTNCGGVIVNTSFTDGSGVSWDVKLCQEQDDKKNGKIGYSNQTFNSIRNYYTQGKRSLDIQNKNDRDRIAQWMYDALPHVSGEVADNKDGSIRVGCGNGQTYLFIKKQCQDQESSFTCEDLSINNKQVDSSGNIVLYAGHFESELSITGIKQTAVKERNCTKTGPNRVDFVLKNTDGNVVAESSTATISEKKSVGTILDKEKFQVIANGGGDLTKSGVYTLDFTLYNGNTQLGRPTGNCSIEIIHDTTQVGDCGVNSNGKWNGNGDGKLSGTEQCDIKSDGTKLGNWGDTPLGCSDECKTISYCGDARLNNGEQCDFNDPSEPWLANNQTCNLSCELVNNPTLSPSISILKYSNNSSDADLNMALGTNLNDSQLIEPDTSSKFQIRIENTGNETLKTVQITDTQAPNCAGSIRLPNPSAPLFNGTNFTITGEGVNTNNSFEPGEILSYDCELPNTTSGYINRAGVTAMSSITDTIVESNDSSDVIINAPSISIETYNGNIDDKDGNITRTPNDDTQTVNKNGEAIFIVEVRNTGTVDLENLVIIDDLNPDCAGPVTLPAEQGNTPGIFFSKSGRIDIEELNDAIFQPNESFIYTCRKSSIAEGYIHNISITATQIGIKSTVTVGDKDVTEVKVLPITSTCNPNGTKESFEICDPQDIAKVGFGSQGCDNSCQPIDGGGGNNGNRGSSGSVPKCLNIDVSGTIVTCRGNSAADTIRVDCGSGDNYFSSGPFEKKNGGFEAEFECKNGISQPSCYVHGSHNITKVGNYAWLSSPACRIGDISEPAICPSNDPRCGVCEYYGSGKLKPGSKESCPEMETIPWGADYHVPTYANNEQNKLLCLKVTDDFGNDIKTSVFDLKGGLPDDVVIVNKGNKPPVIKSGLFTDQVNQTGQEAITIHQAALVDSHVCMLMSSTAPGKQKFEFDIYIPTHEETSEFIWDGGYRKITGAVTSKEVEFKKPFTGEFVVSDGTLQPKINTKQTYDVRLIGKTNWGPVNPTYLYIDRDSVLSTTKDQIFTTFSSLGDQVSSDKVQFKATISADTESAVLASPGIVSNKMEIKYILAENTIRYYLTQGDEGNDRTEFSLAGENETGTLGLKVVGPLQGDGKADITGQVSNFSDISKGPQRSAIKQKAYQITQGLSSESAPVNGVYYVKGKDVVLDSMPDYETLVVENGNVIISGNLTGDKTLGIIAIGNTLKNSNGLYDNGNIIITPTATEINALIYGDGGLVSGDNNGVAYTQNISDRTTKLNKQLILNGTIFTRNTIGGAVDAGSYYKLPGGEQTQNFDEAVIYDLNYLRTSDLTGDYDQDGNPIRSSVYPGYNFIIKYTPGIQNNPPKGFSN